MGTLADLLDVLRAALADRYTIEEEIGRGGMAFVYRARDLKHQRTVAIKVLRPELAAVLGPERFAREIQLTATLNHPRILAIHDSGAAGGLLYYVMPFVTGESLRARLDRERQLPVEDAIAITTAIASALSYAHGQRIVHRDIKPENVMLANGEVIVADFGIGRALETTSVEQLTETGLALGTPEYMSPEQASADPHVDGRSDQFSLGCVLFEMLVGEPPFRGPTMQAIIARRMMEPMPSICAVRRGVPAAVETVARKSLEKAPADRFTTMAVFSAALTRASTGATAKPYTRISLGSMVRRGVVAVLVIAALTAGYIFTHRAEPSIAIMAAHDAAPDHADPSLGPGLVDEIVTRLHDTRLHDPAHGIVVAGQSSVDYLQDEHKAPREIAAALKMRQVLSITIRPAGGKLKVRAELQSAAEEGLIWEHNYLVDSATDVVALADSVAPQVLAHLDVKVPAATLLEWDRRASRNQTAVLAYQNGRRLVATRPSLMSLDSAETYFNAALRIDTSYAEAWSGLSDSYSMRAGLGGIRPSEAFPPALEFATKAVRLDTALAEAYVSLARVHLLYSGDLAAGLTDIQRALHFKPEYADAHLFFGVYHLFVGDYDAALREARKANELDPYSLIQPLRLAAWLIYGGPKHFDEADRLLRTTLERYPGNPLAYANQVLLYVRQDRYPEACRTASLIPDQFAGLEAGFKGYAFGRCGREADARALIDTLEKLSKVRFIVASRIAMAFLGLNERDSAFTWLAKGVEHRDVFVPSAMLEFQSDPRWQDIVRRRRAVVDAIQRGHPR